MKTAIELLLDYIDNHQPKNKTTDGIWSKAKSLLETEKQQIIDAYWNGHNQTEYSIHIA